MQEYSLSLDLLLRGSLWIKATEETSQVGFIPPIRHPQITKNFQFIISLISCLQRIPKSYQ